MEQKHNIDSYFYISQGYNLLSHINAKYIDVLSMIGLVTEEGEEEKAIVRLAPDGSDKD